MEDWLAFTETHSPFLTHDLRWPAESAQAEDPEDLSPKDAFERMWGHLRSAVLFFLRHHDGQHTAERILEAQNNLLEYAALAEQVISSQPDTVSCACVFPDRSPAHMYMWNDCCTLCLQLLGHACVCSVTAPECCIVFH
jgi:hypothetical protein